MDANSHLPHFGAVRRRAWAPVLWTAGVVTALAPLLACGSEPAMESADDAGADAVSARDSGAAGACSTEGGSGARDASCADAIARPDAPDATDAGADASASSARPFPTTIGLVNAVTECGAKGDGMTDDTAALRACIANNVGLHQTIFLPAGTYLISDTLDWKNRDGAWRSYLTLQGAGVGLSTLRLVDHANGFDDASKPKPVMRPGSKTDDPACSNYGQNDGDGAGNCGFENYVFDLTMTTGRNNPGAVALDFQASNYGGVESVRLTSDDGAGAVGLSLTRAVGPALIKGITVEGFGAGIQVGSDLYGITFEHVALRHQTAIGMAMADNMVAIHDLLSDNTVPALRTTGLGLAVLVDGELRGGATTAPAIDNSGAFLARGITTTGYGQSIRSGSTSVVGGMVAEYSSHEPFVLQSTRKTTLDLPIRETPTFHDPDLTQWTNVQSFGGSGADDNDDSAALQRAIDAGTSTVVLPLGRYRVDTTVIVRGAVQRIVGMMSSFYGAADPVFRIEAGTAPFVVLDRFAGGLSVEHASARDVSLRHSAGVSFRAGAGTGALFLEDVVLAHLATGGRSVWARQLDVEGPGPTLIDNAGGALWILGLKTEGASTILTTTAGGSTELLGGLIYDTGDGSSVPAFLDADASVSLSYDEVCYVDHWAHTTEVHQSVAGAATELPRADVVWRGLGGLVPLYVGIH